MAVQQTLFETSGRPCVNAVISPMTLEELQNLEISYEFIDTSYGQIIVGCTASGIATALFFSGGEDPLALVRERFPSALLKEEPTVFSGQAGDFFSAKDVEELNLHVSGTNFQLKVWKALLEIPAGSISSYADIALKTGDAKASRAVGNAVGANPVAVMIPCHRVVRADRIIGNYRWGSERKQQILREETKILFHREN